LTGTLRRRTTGTLLVLSVLAAITVALPSPSAHADGVQAAQARVDSLQALARSTTAALTGGTARWEADQRRLRVLQLDLSNTQRHIQAAQAQVSREQRKVAVLARQLYVHGNAGGLQLAFTAGPDQTIEALSVQHSLEVTSGSQAQIIARAQTARHRLRNEEQQSRQLVQDATALSKASATRLAQLNALADRTSAELSSAQDALQRALAQRSARLAQAARARALAKARAAAARTRSRVVLPPLTRGGPGCSGRPTGGQANGNLDPGSLCPLWNAPGHRLRADAAAAFNRLSQLHAQQLGAPLCVTDSYRSYAAQVSVYHRKPGLAAVPGTSNHGWGLAVDFCGGIQTSGSPAYQWMKANAGRVGFFHPSWAEPGGSKPEAWHWEYRG
jgi:hypothetical protein